MELFEEIWKKLLVVLTHFLVGGRRVPILSLSTSPSYNKCFLAKKIPQRDLGCNYKAGRKAVHEHLQEHPTAGFLSRSWLDLQPKRKCSAAPQVVASPVKRCVDAVGGWWLDLLHPAWWEQWKYKLIIGFQQMRVEGGRCWEILYSVSFVLSLPNSSCEIGSFII